MLKMQKTYNNQKELGQTVPLNTGWSVTYCEIGGGARFRHFQAGVKKNGDPVTNPLILQLNSTLEYVSESV